MHARWIAGTIVGLILGIIVFISKSADKGKVEKDTRYEMHELIATSEAYKVDRDYIEQIFPDAHKEAFSDNYTMGGRYSPGRFDESGYIDEVFGLMIDRAEAEKHDKLAAAL